MFYVYHQLYDEKTGKPVEGAYVDLNGDGEINTEDLYRYHSPAPDYILGFSTSLRWKKWTLSTSLRANIGNYVYNGDEHRSLGNGKLQLLSVEQPVDELSEDRFPVPSILVGLLCRECFVPENGQPLTEL